MSPFLFVESLPSYLGPAFDEHVDAIMAELRRLAAVEADRAQRGVPDGWVLVPVEPTDTMDAAAATAVTRKGCYRAMLAAAPTAPQPLFGGLIAQHEGLAEELAAIGAVENVIEHCKLYNSRFYNFHEVAEKIVTRLKDRGLLAAPTAPQPTAPELCCGEYETCTKACTPRGRFLGMREALAQPTAQAAPEPLEVGGKQFQAKFNLGDHVWYMKNNVPTEVVISAIEIFYVGTNQDRVTYNAKNATNSVSWLDHSRMQEAWLFKSKKELLESL